MRRFYKVAISKSPFSPLVYDYDDVLEIGTRVWVPVRKSKRVGYVVEETEKPSFETRRIHSKIDDSSFLTPSMMQLASEMADLYFVSIGEILDLFFLPSHQVGGKKGKKKLRYIVLSVPISQILKSRLGKREEELVELLLEKEALDYTDILKKFSFSTVHALQKKGYIAIVEGETKEKIAEKKVNLTKEQSKIVEEITKSNKPFHLIYGVTGSGKTEIYFEVAQRVLENSKKVLILVPEISLTPQLLFRTKKRFFDRRVGVYHSALSGSVRREEWIKAVKGKSDVVIGTRSAVWLPIKNLGLVIVDEEQDESFKQYAMRPYYNAVDVAKRRCELEGALLILSSATPRVETYHAAKKEYVSLHVLKERAKGTIPDVKIVDMRGRRGEILSRELINEMEKVAKQGEQSFIFVPRKGFSTRVQCAQCGYIMTCPNCDVALSYHRSKGVVKCHYCGYISPLPKKCPNCGAESMMLGGIGTEKVENEIGKLFPGLRVKRIDREEINDVSSLEKILKEISRMEVDVVVGTKMITKGLDFPRVALVGVVDVDRIFAMPDFRAEERAFQLIAQMAGRAGRGVKGKVLIQTREPNNSIFKSIKDGKYEDFYEEELKRREKLGYPPFVELILLTVENENRGRAKKFSEDLVRAIHQGPFDILGPVEAVIFKLNSVYRYQLLLKCKELRSALDFLKENLTAKRLGFDPKSFLKVDVRPYSV